MTWWLYRSSRLFSEKAAVADLEASVDWLNVGAWQTNAELDMRIDFNVDVGDESFAFEMIYPSVFPDTPPMIYTKDKSRISFHQYGASGELCLEYRPDNWQQAVTGADMIASCQRLLTEERPAQGEVVHAHSAHVASLGRDTRSKFCRLLLTSADFRALNALPQNDPKHLALKDQKTASNLVSSLRYIGDKENPDWISDLLLPPEGRNETGFVVRCPGVGKKADTTVAELRARLDDVHLSTLAGSLFDNDNHQFLLIGDEEYWHLFWIYGEVAARKIAIYTTLRLPDHQQRLPADHVGLAGKKVGIVGCGSVGSKIAASLCRSGVDTFYLIDEDIFFPGNVVRNDLDLNDTGVHKADAVRDRLLRINPIASVKTLRIALGGQESAKSVAGALETLGSYDLLIDATAEPTAFNMIASVSTRKKVPMIWCEVFAGGIGGIIARSRPDIDPVPLAARAQIGVWCSDQDVDWVRSVAAEQYESRNAEGTPQVATDAEITIIAAHAARFATDILARPRTSIFPMSAYIIGFSSDWIFDQPFDTRPIDLLPHGVWGENAEQLEPSAILKLLHDHLPPTEETDENPTPE